MKPTRVAVAGCGSIAVGGHLPACRASAEAGLCELVGVCDILPERAQSVSSEYGAPGFGTLAEMLDETRPEVLSITTFPDSHLKLALQAFTAGCHVLCEKPVAMSAAEAAQMVTASEEAGLLLGVCFQYRHWDESVWLKERIAGGDLGHVHSIRTWGGGVHGFATNPDYHRMARAGGGILAHWTIHNLDLALWLLDHPEPVTASAFCHQRLRTAPEALGPSRDVIDVDTVEPEIEDFALAFVRLQGGAVITVEADWLQPPSERHEGWELLGERGAASLSPLRFRIVKDGSWIDDGPGPGTLAPGGYGMERLYTAFLKAVRSGGPSPVPGPEIVRIQRLMDALYDSAAREREVPVRTPNHERGRE